MLGAVTTRRRGPRAESAGVARVKGGGLREHLQGHSPTKRDLLGFIDDRHAAAADLAEQAEIAEDPMRTCLVARGIRLGDPTRVAWRVNRQTQAGHHRHRGEELLELLRLIGIPDAVGVDVNRFADLELVDQLLNQFVEDRVGALAEVRLRGSGLIVQPPLARRRAVREGGSRRGCGGSRRHFSLCPGLGGFLER